MLRQFCGTKGHAKTPVNRLGHSKPMRQTQHFAAAAG